MKKLRCLAILLVFLIAVLAPAAVQAQTYRFEVSEYEVEAYLEADGSLTLYYYMVFQNDPNADPIDFIDLGLPQADYEYKNITGTINDQPIPKIGPSSYVDGAELALQDLAIQPGQSGTVIVTATKITGILFPYDQPDRENYVNFQFSPNYFGSQYDQSTATKYRMTIILPPGVGVNDGVYYTPSGWPGDDTPEASTTTDGRVYYSWYTENADVHTPYIFGAAFPASAVPADAIITAPPVTDGGDASSSSPFIGFWNFITGNLGCCIVPGLIIAFMIWANITGRKKLQERKLEYMPPKISIEGQGIKRGLTAVEAGILMQEPLDKILTMILFGLLKKEAITITNKDPLTIEPVDPLPEGLYDYEKEFIEAFKLPNNHERTKALQSMMINLVQSVALKMKGFSQKETVAYYKDIVNRAWKAVEEAQTPEVKSAQYEHTLEWEMLDKDFNQKTQDTLSGGPVIIPTWWWRYDPTFRPSPAMSTGGGGGVAAPVSSGGGVGSSKPSVSLPHIPGSDFAASMINGASNLAAGVIGNVTGFTSAITNKTNPIPVQVSTPRSGGGGFRGGGGGGHSCACACACAGCACACAGGGR